MVVSHRESSISSNIRAIIEQLNLNPVERRRLIDKTRQDSSRPRCKSYPDGLVVESQAPKITIGVYGCKDRAAEFEMPSPISKPATRRIEIERSRSKAEARQRHPVQKIEALSTCQVKKETLSVSQVKIEAPSVQVKIEAPFALRKGTRVEYANEVNRRCRS